MKNTKIKTLLAIIGILTLTSLAGCDGTDVQNAANSTQNNIKQGAADTKDQIKNGANSVQNGLHTSKTDFTPEESSVNLDYLLAQLKSKGYDPKIIKAQSEPFDKLFYVPHTEVQINGGYVFVYQYGINQKQFMQNDINMLNDKSSILENKSTWTAPPHLYQKGRLAVIYEGSSQPIMNSLSEILGMPILG